MSFSKKKRKAKLLFNAIILSRVIFFSLMKTELVVWIEIERAVGGEKDELLASSSAPSIFIILIKLSEFVSQIVRFWHICNHLLFTCQFCQLILSGYLTPHISRFNRVRVRFSFFLQALDNQKPNWHVFNSTQNNKGQTL